MFATFAASLQTRSKKFKDDEIGPLQVKAVLDNSLFSISGLAWEISAFL